MNADVLVRDVGEFGLISALVGALPETVRAGPGLEIGIGDDAAVWEPSAGAKVVVTTDSLVEEIHFRLDWTDWESLGHKALAVNLSDMAAMGAAPRLAVLSLGLRGGERVRDLQALYRGAGALALRHGVLIGGGDIVHSPGAVLLHVTVLGEAAGGRVLTRAGAEPGDVIGVTGTLGASAAGLRLLALDRDDARRQAATADRLIEAHLWPEPRIRFGEILRDGGATAAMDLSDGLLGDLPKILKASGVSAELDSRDVPVAAAVRALFPDDWIDLALRGGEDYELLFTLPPAAWDGMARDIQLAGGAVSRIGTIERVTGREPAMAMIGLDGSRESLEAGAFDHFRA